MDLDDLKRRMRGAVSVLREEFGGLRTGRASISLLDPIHVDIYGTSMPINQVATVSVLEPRMISVQVWDKGTAGPVERAIRESDLGLNPVVEGQLLRIPIPELNEERRHKLVKVAHKYAGRRAWRCATFGEMVWKVASGRKKRRTESGRAPRSFGKSAEADRRPYRRDRRTSRHKGN